MLHLDFSFLDWEFLRNWISKGFLFSVQLTLTAMIGGIILGTVLALMRLSGRAWLEKPAAAYVDTLRSVPLVMVILWFYLLVPGFLRQYGIELGSERSALITFTLFEATYYSEIMRAGIQSVSRGQVFAGYAMGMSYRQTMQLVVLPQAFRNMLPVLLTQTIVLFQDTSLVYAINAYDLLKGFESAGKNINRPIETYLLAALVYLIICFSLSMLVRRLQKKIAIIR